MSHRTRSGAFPPIPGTAPRCQPGRRVEGPPAAGGAFPPPPEFAGRRAQRRTSAGLPGTTARSAPARSWSLREDIPDVAQEASGTSESKAPRAPGPDATPRPHRPPGSSRRAGGGGGQAPPALGHADRRRREPRIGRRRATRPGARSSRRRSGRRGGPEAGRRGAGDPGFRRDPPCPAPVRRAAQRPPGGAGGDRQGLRPRGAIRQHATRLRRRLAAVRLLAAPPGAAGDAARSGSRRPLPRVASRARRGGGFGCDRRAAAVRDRLALPAARRPIGDP